MADGIEKRRHLRLSAMGPVQVLAQGGTPQAAYLASIGRGGFGLYLHQEVHPGQLLLVNLHLLSEPGEADELKVVARVRWSRAVEALWMAGFAFEQMSDVRYQRLLKHLKVLEALQLGTRDSEVPATRVRFSVKE
jgi:hypothetical protein